MDIKELREQIDEIDSKIVALLDRRFEIVKNIGKEKARRGISIESAKRESEILSAISDKAANSVAVQNIYAYIFKESKQVQRAQLLDKDE